MSEPKPETQKKPATEWLGDVRDRVVGWVDRWLNPPLLVPVPVRVRVRR